MMSHWDFGRRPDAAPDAEHDAPPPAGPADTAYQPDLMLGWGDAWDDDEDEGTAPYPITYERDDLAPAPPLPAPPGPPDAPWAPRPSAPYPVSHEAPGPHGALPGRDAGSAAPAGGQPPDDPWH